METFEAIRPGLGLLPLAVGLICFAGAYVSSQRKEPFVYRLVAGILIVLLTGIVPNFELQTRDVLGLMIGGYLCDAISAPRMKPEMRVLMAIGIGSVFMLGNLPTTTTQRVMLAPSALVISQGGATKVQREKLRILEISGAGERLWHIKDGTSMVSLNDFNDYKDAKGMRISAQQVVDRIEEWAEVDREHFAMQSDGSLSPRSVS